MLLGTLLLFVSSSGRKSGTRRVGSPSGRRILVAAFQQQRENQTKRLVVFVCGHFLILVAIVPIYGVVFCNLSLA